MTEELVQSKRTVICAAQSLEEAAYNLIRDGWTRLSHTALPPLFDQVIPAFADLTTDPRRDEYLIRHPREFDDGEPALGLMPLTNGKVKPNPRLDELVEGRARKDARKFRYHHNLRSLGYFAAHPGLVERNSMFFLRTAEMFSAAILLGREIAEELDKQLPGFYFAERMRMQTDHFLLRLLRYLCTDERPEMAQPHTDRDFLTVHIRSDRPGLFLVDGHGTLITDANEDDQESILLFFGRHAWEITRGELRAIPHGVIDTTFRSRDRAPRHTAVCFLHGYANDSSRIWAEKRVGELAMPQCVHEYIAQAM
jgi:hypothetical protein